MRIFSSLLFLTLLIASCANEKEIELTESQHHEPICGGVYSKNRIELEGARTYRATSSVHIIHGIKGSDTIPVSDLLCVDSVLFTQAFNSIQVDKICQEMHIEGNTYFSATTNKFGGFEEITVLRSVDKCFLRLEEKIKQKVLTMRTLSEEYGNMTIVFFHKFRMI